MNYKLEPECNLGYLDKNRCPYLNSFLNKSNTSDQYSSCWECPFHGKLKEQESQPEVINDEEEDHIDYALNPAVFLQSFQVIKGFGSNPKGAIIDEES